MTLTLVAPPDADRTVNGALVQAANLLDLTSTATMHDGLLRLTDFETFWGPLGRRTVTVLYSAWRTDGDYLRDVLAEIAYRHENLRDLTWTTEHDTDGPCFAGGRPRCSVCQEAAEEWLAGALQKLRHLLANVLGDLRAVA